MLFNTSFQFLDVLQDIPQEDIAACPPIPAGASLSNIMHMPNMPRTIKEAVAQLPYDGTRRHTWVYVRPQYIEADKPDTRSGAFFHIDADAIYRALPLSWDDFRIMAVSFGNLSETQFIAEPLELDIPEPAPTSSDYVRLAKFVENGKQWKTASPLPCQVAKYTLRDFHRAGPIRGSGWRLILVIFETDADQPEQWR